MLCLEHKIGVALLTLLFPLSLVNAESFSAFYVRFMSNPRKQAASVSCPFWQYGKKNTRLSAFSPVSISRPQQMALLCSDSLSGAGAGPSVSVAALNLSSSAGHLMQFSRSGGKWKLHALTKAVASKNVEASFFSFLQDYSRNRDFQMKHTIFPLPQHYYRGGVEVNTRLLMTRDWTYLNFLSLCPEISAFQNCGSKTNRRLYRFNGAHLSQIYNFILINRKWFLIEIENY